jgi:hypothetical protein
MALKYFEPIACTKFPGYALDKKGGTADAMIELIVTVTITVSSILLFCYWFRYTCHLILSAATSRDFATNVARAHQLGYQDVRLRLSHGATGLGQLKDMLDHDYAVLARLMNQAEDGQAGIERLMLVTHYRLTAVWYQIISTISAAGARKALEEMSGVVAHFANCIGEASLSPAAA